MSKEGSAIFAESYRAEGGDFNLNSRRWQAVAEYMDISFWYDLCNEVVDKAESLLRDRELPTHIATAKTKAISSTGLRVQQLESRRSVASPYLLPSIEGELAFEERFKDALIKSITQPTLRVDAIGAIFVSPHNPFMTTELEEDDE